MNKLKQLRMARSKTQSDMAEILKVTPASYCMMENEKRGIKRKHLETLADFFNVSTDYILCQSDKQRVNMKEIDEMQRLFDEFCKQANDFIKKEKEKNDKRNRGEEKIFR